MHLFRMIGRAPSLSLVVLSVAACSDVAPPTAPLEANSVVPSLNRVDTDHANDSRGGVYTLTNAVDGNAVIAFRRGAEGALTRIGTFATGGRGIGGTVDPLTSQYSVVLSPDHHALFAVNAGSNQVSSFRVNDNGSLTLASVVASGGDEPVSIAVFGKIVYVLNTNDNHLAGYRIIGNARLVSLPRSGRSLAPGANGAAAVRFTPDGRQLVVSERVSNRLEVFPVNPDGRLREPVVSTASGGASFGFDITKRNQPIVSETQGSLTSYSLALSGSLTPITASISTSGSAACWVIITSDGRFAYTTNAGSNSIAGFAITSGGQLSALIPGAPTINVDAGASPIDLDQVGGRLLYVLEAGKGTIGSFKIADDGTLIARSETVAGLSASGLQGLAAF